MDDYIKGWAGILVNRTDDIDLQTARNFIRDLCRSLTDCHVAAIEKQRVAETNKIARSFNDGVRAAIRAIQEEAEG